MEPFVFTDSSGRQWEVIDYRTVQGRKKRVPLNSWRAEARAFVALDTGEVRVYSSLWYYHSTESKLLANELRFSKPVRVTAAERMNRS